MSCHSTLPLPCSRITMYLQDKHEIREGMAYAQYAEQRGFEAVWQAESRLVRDAIVPMAAFAAVTSRMKIGSGVINNWTRNIGLLAATFLTLDDLAPNRIICGIGAWWDPLAKNVGVERKKPMKAMRETIEVLKRLLNMERVTFHGEFHYEALKHLAIGAKKAGRNIDDIDRPQLVVCSVDYDHHLAVQAAKELITQYLAQQPHIAQASGTPPETVKKVQSILGWPATKEQIHQAMQFVPDELIERITASGTPDEVRAKVEEYNRSGCTCPILYPLGDDVKLMIDTFAQA